MDEKELIKKIKNSFKVGKTRAQITERLQGKNLKLEYIDVLIKKAKPAKTKIWITLLLVLVLVLLIVSGVFSYLLFFQKGVKMNLENPFEKINKQEVINEFKEVSAEKIEIKPEFITYSLNELDAYNLHKNPLTGEKAMIEFDISGEMFCSEMHLTIETSRGECNLEEDLRFIVPKEDIVEAILSENPEEEFKQDIKDGVVEIEQIASESELFLKGYLSLYDSLEANE